MLNCGHGTLIRFGIIVNVVIVTLSEYGFAGPAPRFLGGGVGPHELVAKHVSTTSSKRIKVLYLSILQLQHL